MGAVIEKVLFVRLDFNPTHVSISVAERICHEAPAKLALSTPFAFQGATKLSCQP